MHNRIPILIRLMGLIQFKYSPQAVVISSRMDNIEVKRIPVHMNARASDAAIKHEATEALVLRATK